MSASAYRLLGLLVWRGGRWYMRRRYGHKPKWISLAALGAGLAIALAAGGRRRLSGGA